MIQEGEFGIAETISLLVIALITKAFFTSPSMVMKTVGTTGWYMTLISAAVATIGFTFVYLLLKHFPGKNIMEIYNIVLGKVGGFIFSLILLAIILVTLTVNIREFTDVLKVYVMPVSPPSYIIAMLCSVLILAGFLGLESIARLSKLFAGILLVGLVTVLALSIQNYRPNRIFPILGYGLDITIRNGLLRSSAYGELIIIGVFANSLQGTKYVKKAGYLSCIISAVTISIILLTFTMSFPYFTGREVTAPMYLMSSLISYGKFFQRLEPIFLFVWNISAVISFVILFYMILMIYCHMFRIQDNRPLVIPLVLIIFTLAMVSEGIVFLITEHIQILRIYGWIPFFIPPMITLFIAKIRKKGEIKRE